LENFKKPVFLKELRGVLMKKILNWIYHCIQKLEQFIVRNFFKDKNSKIKKFLKVASSPINLLKFISQASISGGGVMQIHLVEHCNLNCANCDHFSSLAQPEFLDLETFTKDLQRLAELAGREGIPGIHLCGGEPLLHKEVCSFMKIARKNFPNSEISLLTNGILLSSMDDEFWQTCKKENIVVSISAYPINIDRAKIKEKLEFYGIASRFLLDNAKTMWHFPLDFAGKGNTFVNFMNCPKSSTCSYLMYGKIFPCAEIPNICHFNKYFGKELPVDKKDYIDIYKVKSVKEILKFLSRPVPFCRYCRIKNITYGHTWKRTQRDISEWTIKKDRSK
jgi:hypothetical protein